MQLETIILLRNNTSIKIGIDICMCKRQQQEIPGQYKPLINEISKLDK